MNNLGILMKYEWKKLLQKKLVVISFVIIFLLTGVGSVSLLLQTVTVTYENAEGVETEETLTGVQIWKAWKENARALHGRKLDSDLIKEIINMPGQNPFVHPYDEVSYILRKMTGKKITELPDITTEELYAGWRSGLRQNYEDYYLNEKEIAYWEQKADSIEIPFVYRYDLGWSHILGMVLTNTISVLLLVAVCLAGIFTDEHKLGTDQMIFCTQNAKQIYAAKVLTGSLFGAGCAIILYAVVFGMNFLMFGTDGYHAILQQEMTTYPYAITLGEAALILFGLTVLAGILESVFTMFLSEALNNNLAVMSIVVSIMLLTQFISVPERYRVLSQLWGFLPTNLITYWGFGDGRLVPFIGGYLTSFQFGALLYPVLSAGFVFLTYKVYDSYSDRSAYLLR